MVSVCSDESLWHRYASTARVGLIALTFLVSLPEVGLCLTKVAQQGQAEEPQSIIEKPPQKTSISQAVGKYEPNCYSPATREDAEYCQERGATNAAEEQANLALDQLLASIAGIGAVAGTVYLTFRATSAAVDSASASRRSAEAAEDAVRAMREIDQRQGADVKASIAESARAADAMSNVAVQLEETGYLQQSFWKRQMRAYLSVSYGEIAAQNRDRQYRYDIRLLLINNGHTPAHDVVYTAKANVLPRPLPEAYDLSLPHTSDASKSVIGPGQHVIINALLPKLYTDEEIAEFTSGSNRVYVWGEAIYKDEFSATHTVKFCQYLTWYTSGKTTGTNTSRHNESD